MKFGCREVPDIEIVFNNEDKIIFDNLNSFSRKAINNFQFNDIIEFEVAMIDLNFYKKIAQDQIKLVNIIYTGRLENGEDHVLTQILTHPKVELRCNIDSSGSYMPYKIIIAKK